MGGPPLFRREPLKYHRYVMTAWGHRTRWIGRLSWSVLLLTGASTWGQDGAPVSQVKLGLEGDPSRSIAVSWRAPADALRGVVQLAPGERPDFGICNDPCREVAADATALTARDAGALRFFRASLGGLSPDTVYSYRVGDGSRFGPVYRFRTAPTGGAFRLGLVGELHIGDRLKPGWKAVAQALLEADPRLVMSTGDNVDSGGLEGEWERFFGQAPGFFGRIPFMSAVGNHEVYGSAGGNPALYLANFATPKNGADGSGRSYSLDIAGVHLVSLEANPATRRENFQRQVAWLERDLAGAAGRSRFQIVVLHSPILHSKLSRTQQPRLNFRYENPEFPEGLMPLFDRYGVDLVVAGHDKAYVRSQPMVAQAAPGQTPAVAPRTVANGQGTVYVQLSSSGGRYRDFLKQPWMAVGQPGAGEYLLLDILPDRLEAQALRAGGAVADRFTVLPRPAR